VEEELIGPTIGSVSFQTNVGEPMGVSRKQPEVNRVSSSCNEAPNPLVGAETQTGLIGRRSRPLRRKTPKKKGGRKNRYQSTCLHGTDFAEGIPDPPLEPAAYRPPGNSAWENAVQGKSEDSRDGDSAVSDVGSNTG